MQIRLVILLDCGLLDALLLNSGANLQPVGFFQRLPIRLQPGVVPLVLD